MEVFKLEMVFQDGKHHFLWFATEEEVELFRERVLILDVGMGGDIISTAVRTPNIPEDKEGMIKWLNQNVRRA